MDDQTPVTTNTSRPLTLPFNNLYLISGLVHGYNRVWMYFFTLTMLVLGYVLYQAIVLFPLMNVLIANGYSQEKIMENANLLFDSNALRMDRNLVLVLEFGMFVLAFAGFYTGIRAVHHKELVHMLTGYEKFRYRRFWFAFMVWGIFLIATVISEYILKAGDLRINFYLPGFLISCLVMIVFMPIQTGLEEVVFRGYLIQGLSQIFKNGIIPLIITSLLFAFAHMSNPEVKQYGWAIMFTYYCGFALFMGAITLVDEGLELAFGIHFANNIISSMLVTSSHSVVKSYSVFETSTENPYTEIIIWLVMAAATFGIFWYKYRWRNFKLIIK